MYKIIEQMVSVLKNPRVIFFGLVLMASVLLYFPSLYGSFLFDDFPNLSPIGANGEIRSWEQVKGYVFSGFSGPTGRPVALATFLLNARDWPASPFYFKLTNLVLHVACALLVFYLFVQLTKRFYSAKKALWLAALAASLWLLHPYWVSTVAYVVQRMTILSALFSLCCLACYLHYRQACARGDIRALMKLTLCVSVFGFLAVFSKENAVLIPLLILVIEVVVFADESPCSKNYKVWRTVCLYVPSVLVVGYLVWLGISQWGANWSHRSFDLGERLLSQPRILFSYLYDIVIPKASTQGLFSDGVAVSRGFFDPVSTLFAVLGLLLLTCLAFIFRRRALFFSLGVLFFLAGHLIESTTVSLELYFEHRNYLPSIFLILGLVVAVDKFIPVKKFKVVIFGTLILVFGVALFLRAELWSNKDRLMLTWAENAPQSVRAQLQAAVTMVDRRQYDRADYFLTRAHSVAPQSINPKLAKLMLECTFLRGDALGEDFYEQLERALGTQPFHISSFNYLRATLERHYVNGCRQLSYDRADELISAFMVNPNLSSATRQGMMLSLRGRLNLQYGQNELASRDYQESFRLWRSIDPAMLGVAEMASFGQYQRAIELLDLIEANYTSPTALRAKRDYVLDLEYLRGQIISAANGDISGS